MSEPDRSFLDQSAPVWLMWLFFLGLLGIGCLALADYFQLELLEGIAGLLLLFVASLSVPLVLLLFFRNARHQQQPTDRALEIAGAKNFFDLVKILLKGSTKK